MTRKIDKIFEPIKAQDGAMVHKDSLGNEDSSLTLFSLKSEVAIEGTKLPHFHAVSTTKGENLTIKNTSDEESSTLVFISKRIDEPIA